MRNRPHFEGFQLNAKLFTKLLKIYEQNRTKHIKPRIAIYTRVSTDKQSNDSQLLELRDDCQRRQWSNVAEYSDVISGAKFTRSGSDKLMIEIRRGKLDVVICFKLDRFCWSLAHLAQIYSELTTHGVALVCTSQGIDTSNNNPAGWLQLGVLKAVAEFERSIIQERAVAGLKAAKARGVKLGRKETLSQHQERVGALVAQGVGVRAIARELNLPSLPRTRWFNR